MQLPGRCKRTGRVELVCCLIVLNFVFDYSFILRVVLFYNKINKV